MNYLECLEYINERSQVRGSILGLESIDAICREFDNPQDKLKFIHIAGTNGKGSTLCFVSSILSEAGYKVGRYISPTIRDYRERFQINGKMITQKALCSYMEKVKEVASRLEERGIIVTAFEMETVIAFLYFVDQKCDVVVLECGMGGLTDATNIVNTKVLTIFTPISMDHMQFLGNALTDIAKIKCGIIRPGVPIISAHQKEEVRSVIETYDNYKLFIDPDDISTIKYCKTTQKFKYKGINYETSLLGTYQIENAALAVETANTLKEKCGYEKINEIVISRGLLKAVWPARFQIVSKKPVMVIDGAHNEDASIRLRETLDIFYPEYKKIYIIGMFRDKEVDKVLANLVSDGEMVFAVATPNNPRALSSIEMAEAVRKYNNKVTSCDSVEEAVEYSMAIADNKSVIVACGSLAYLGKIIDIMT